MLGGAAVVLPRPTVIPSDPVDPSNPLSASFTIINNSFIPLRHVTTLIGIGRVFSPDVKEFPPRSEDYLPDFRTRLTREAWTNHSLDIDERFTVTPEDVIHGPSGAADIAVVVIYRPWFIHWDREKLFRFKTYRQTNGNLYWYSFPSN